MNEFLVTCQHQATASDLPFGLGCSIWAPPIKNLRYAYGSGHGTFVVVCRGGVEDTRLKAKDTKKFRGQGQGQTLSTPRPRTKDTDASVLQKKRSSKIFFRRSQKKGLQKFFQARKVFKNFFLGDLYLRKPKNRSLQIFRKVSGVSQRNFNGSKIMLSSSRGQGNFRGLEASRPRPSQGLQNVSWRTSSMPRTCSRTPLLVVLRLKKNNDLTD